MRCGAGTEPTRPCWRPAPSQCLPRRGPSPRPFPNRRCVMRVALYVRVSTQHQTQTQTIEQQLDRLRAYAQTQGWPLADELIFRDDGFSGASLHRPGLERLREQVAAGALDRLLLTAPDRLARNYAHQV